MDVQYAAELVGMSLQRLVDHASEEPWVCLQVDMRNAFNTVDRSAMLAQCAKKVPAAYDWLSWCYEQHCPLFCQGKLLLSSRTGVHQGDAMGPLGFALGLDAALDKCQEFQVGLWCAWYLEDGTVVGSVTAVAAYLQALSPALSAIGLQLNLVKTVARRPGLQKEVSLMAPEWELLQDNHPLKKCTSSPSARRRDFVV